MLPCTKVEEESMYGDSDEDWIYLLPQQDATAADGEETSKQPSPGAAGAQHSSWDDEADRRQEYPDWYTPEEVEFEKAYRTWIAASHRANGKIDACKYYKEKALRTCTAACERADAKIVDAECEQRKADLDYSVACQRFYDKVDGGGAAAASASANTGGHRDPVVENSYYYDRYNSNDNDGGTYPYSGGYAGGSGPASLGLVGSGYDYGVPGTYGPAAGSSGYGGNYPYQAPPPALHPAPAPAAYVPWARPDFSRYPARADEPFPPAAVAPTMQPPASTFLDSVF